jgi:hypothetical protein
MATWPLNERKTAAVAVCCCHWKILMRSRGIHRRPPSRRVSATAAAAIRTASQAVYMDLMFLPFKKNVMKYFFLKNYSKRK